MSSIYDNIEQPILPELRAYLKQAYRADFCAGYFNLRGWQQIDSDIEQFEGSDGQACRLLVGMYRLPKRELRQALAIGVDPERIDQGQAIRLQTLMAYEFRQQLMSRYMVRRTRSFIKNTYARQDGERYYLEFADGRRSYFPTRHPRTVRFAMGEPQTDPYARLYADRVVDVINALNLPRYGLGLYIAKLPNPAANAEEEQLLANLSHAEQRLMGFCRTNLFKRLESSGAAFIQSLERHILRNYVYLHAIAQDLPLPIGSQDAALLDEVGNDEDEDSLLSQDWETSEGTTEAVDEDEIDPQQNFAQRAAQIYRLYLDQYPRRFKWIRANLFRPELQQNLQQDATALIGILRVVYITTNTQARLNMMSFIQVNQNPSLTKSLAQPLLWRIASLPNTTASPPKNLTSSSTTTSNTAWGAITEVMNNGKRSFP